MAGLAITAAVLLIPFEQTIAPEWTVYTRDATGHPVRGVTVREVWQQYSLEGSDHEEDRRTDDAGRVMFPRRVKRSGLAVRFVGCAYQFATMGVHASCGPVSYLVPFGAGTDTMDWAEVGSAFGTTASAQESVLHLRERDAVGTHK